MHETCSCKQRLTSTGGLTIFADQGRLAIETSHKQRLGSYYQERGKRIRCLRLAWSNKHLFTDSLVNDELSCSSSSK